MKIVQKVSKNPKLFQKKFRNPKKPKIQKSNNNQKNVQTNLKNLKKIIRNPKNQITLEKKTFIFDKSDIKKRLCKKRNFLHFDILGDNSLTRALQSTLFRNPGGVP